MQTYRLNYTLLIGLIVGTLVASGAVYGLWRFQLARNSGKMLAEAEAALAAKNYREAATYFSQYLAIQPDDDESRIKLANVYADVTDQDDVKPEDWGNAINTMESTLRSLPDAKDLRRRLAELYARVGRIPDALGHVEILLSDTESTKNDTELKSLKAQYLARSGDYDKATNYAYELIGYDDKEETFDETKATAPHEVQVYATLATVLRHRRNDPELGDRVINEMVKVNPESAEAYLLRGQYFTANDNKEQGREDFEKAYELDPKNADVLLAMAGTASDDDEYEQARKYLEAGRDLYPDDTRMYQALAGLEYKQKNYDGAMAEVNAGLKAVAGNKAQILMMFKSDLQLQNEDLEGVRQTIEDMQKVRFPGEYIEWLQARIKLAEGKWFEASQDLEILRPRLSNMFDLATQLELFLGLCYEKLGEWEKARESYTAVLTQNPDNQPALAGRFRAEQRLGVATREETRPTTSSKEETDPGIEWQRFITAQLRLPNEERDWALIDTKLLEMAKERNLAEGDVKLMQANLALLREDYPRARQLLQEADKLLPKNLRVRLMAVEVLRADPKQGATVAMKLLEKVQEEFGDLPALRLQRAQLLMNLNPEDLKTQLVALSQAPDDWSNEQKVELWRGMAGVFLNLGMREDTARVLTLSADHQPNNLPTRLALFTLAMESNDDEGMKAAQDKILEIVKDKNNATWLFTEARRQLLAQRLSGQADPAALAQIRILVDRAVTQRPGWNELYLLSAELELMAGNAEAALQNYEKAAELGRGSASSLAQHIRLVSAMGNFRRAKALLDEMPENARQTLLGPLYAEILFRTNEVDNAIASARAVAKADNKSFQNHYWLAQLLARSVQIPGRTEAKQKEAIAEAIIATQRAIELQPESADAWYLLITLNRANGDLEQARAALREAQLAMSGDNLTLFLAKANEALGAWFDAETMYRSYLDANPDDVGRAQQLAEFYLGNIYRQPDKQDKATPLLNQILKAGADGKIKPNDPNLLWARRMGAKLLAASGDYQQLLKAEKLLASNSQGGTLTLEDKLELANILAPRHEPESRRKAVRLLQEVAQIQPLNLAGDLSLGKLYYALGEWNNCKSQMQSTFSRYGNSAAVREAYIRMLLEHGAPGDYDEATRHLAKLREIAPNSSSTFVLSVRVAAKTGRQQEARDELLRRLPQLTKGDKFSPEQVKGLALAAGLLVDLGDLDNAEKIHRLLAEKEPNQAYGLAMFLGLHRSVDQCFEQLNKLHTQETAGKVLEVGAAVVRKRREEVGDKYDAQIDQWFDRALRENPGSISLLMAQADFRDTQQRYDEAAAILEKLLGRKDLKGLRRAVVLNNLSYLVALSGAQSGQIEPLKLVEEAKDILGPTSDILDTRAVVQIAKGNFQAAASDLELAVTDQPTPSKYFHKVLAHLGMNENKLAIEAWDKAEALGLKRDSLNPLEYKRYEETKQKINTLRSETGAVTQSEPLRRAG